jgi:nitrate/TMAO reductase-like tetraheme cytochrome c subunit
MSDNDVPFEPPQADGGSSGPGPDDRGVAAKGSGVLPLRERVRAYLIRGAAVVGALGLLLALLTGLAGMYTSRPQFCRSCHIMEPYYVSWKESSHSHVACTKCHFPPGAGEKVRGKMLGLVQLAQYVTASSGPRLAAEVPDASCLRSGCHERRLLSGRVDFQGVPFDHRPHFENLPRGKKLRCTSCHSQIVQGKHMTVTPTTCFLCHFKEQQFNEGLGVCTRCHQIPERDFDLGGGVTFNHELAYDRGVDCENCHGGLIRGNGDVPRERCQVCHSREGDLARIDDHEFVHNMHVTEHKVDCIECHLTIEHSFDKHRIEHAASDCASCHPNHHSEQVDMLRGQGGRLVSARTVGMASARIACPTCHQMKEASSTGTVLWRASTQVCSECHSAAEVDRYQAYHEALRASLGELQASVKLAQDALATAGPSSDQGLRLGEQLTEIQHDVDFLRIGNDIHNLHYASTLAEALVTQLVAVSEELGIKKPQIALPDLKKVDP